MITEAIIINIDHASNTCVVRIPLLETVNTLYPAALPATFSCQPGVYNGYAKDDMVWVGFAQNRPDKPVVLGKIYKGVSFESKAGGSAIKSDNLLVTGSAELPFNTAFSGVNENFNTPKKIADGLTVALSQPTQGYIVSFIARVQSGALDVFLRTTQSYTNEYGAMQLISNLKAAGFAAMSSGKTLYPASSSSQALYGVMADETGTKLLLQAASSTPIEVVSIEKFKCVPCQNV